MPLSFFKIALESLRDLGRWFYVLLFFHVIAIIYSVGFHHFDEHFQILEFMNMKLGGSDAANLPWEYRLKMRPWLQPSLFYAFTKAWNFIGVTSPTFLSAFFRLISGVLGLFSLGLILKMLKNFLGDSSKYNNSKYIVALVWFLPYINVRPSSDNYGVIFFVFGMALILLSLPAIFLPSFLNNSKIKLPDFSSDRFSISWPIAIISGLMFGLSFQFRYQMGVAILFFYLWCLLYGRVKITSGLVMTISLIGSLAIGIAIDTWGYETFSFSPWNYLYEDIKAHVESTILPNPWWDYFRFTLIKGIPPISFLLIIGTLVFWFFNFSHPLTWVTLPFFLAHTAIAHKELRYIFLVVIFAPFMTMLVLDKFQNFRNGKAWKVLLAFLVVVNFGAMFVSSIKPAHMAARFYHYMEGRTEIKQLVVRGENPYQMLGMPLDYYRPSSLSIDHIDEISDIASQDAGQFYVLTTKGHEIPLMSDKKECTLEYSNYPRWSLDFNYFNWVQKSRIWALWNCKF